MYHEKEGHFDAENLALDKVGSEVYGTQLAVIGTDEYNRPIIQWSFLNAFPTELQSIKLNYQNTGEITCSCSFVFSQMYIKNHLLSN
jgi:hypothetical protein